MYYDTEISLFSKSIQDIVIKWNMDEVQKWQRKEWFIQGSISANISWSRENLGLFLKDEWDLTGWTLKKGRLLEW